MVSSLEKISRTKEKVKTNGMDFLLLWLGSHHEDGYLKGFKYGLGPRFLVEMETWMKQTFKNDVLICE